MKVCKFGGTSMADAESINQAAAIINSDPTRKFVVVSAPGKRSKDDDKITDLFYRAYFEAKSGNCDKSFSIISERFTGIVNDLGLDLDIQPYLDKIKSDLLSGETRDYAASRGEFLSAVIVAKKLGFEFVDAVEIIKFFDDGTFDSEYTNDLAKARLEISEGAVIPGFYGLMGGEKIKTFSRGGSDVTGAIIARAVNAGVYENWTDVNGFLACDPRIVPEAEYISVITYKELRELSYMGASVLHPDAIFPVRKSNIPINIKNTFQPEHPGTMIIPTSKRRAAQRIVTGIAGRKNFIAIHLEKSMMNGELGFARRALSILEHHRVSVEHMPSGIDTMSLVIESQEVDEELLDILKNDMIKQLAADSISIVKNLSLIATVGHGMSNRKGTAAKLFSALSAADINVRMIDQGSSELNIIVAVDTGDFEKAIRAIYKAFLPRKAVSKAQ